MSLFGAGFTVGGGNSKPRRNTTSAPPVVAPIRPSMNDLRVPGTNVRLRKGRRPGQPVNPNTERMYSGLDPNKSNRAARDAYNSELEAIMAEFDEAMRSAGGGGGGYGRAIQKAKEQLQDIQANRAAIKKTYEEYGAFIDPISQEAIDAAVAMVAEAQPQFANIAQAAAEELQASFDAPDQVLSEEAQLIAAGAQNIEAMTAHRDGLNALYMAQEQDAANQATNILGLTSEAARLSAVAEQKLDQGEMRRRAEQVDIGFKQMEDQAREQLEQARAAARAAAAAAAARRRALAKQQEAAIAELDERYNNPAMRGRINAAEFLRREAGDLDYNRQQLMWNTLTEVIERQVPVGEIRRFVNGEGQVMSNKELFLLEGAARSFITGMRAQQNRTPSSSIYNLRTPAYTITPPSRG